MALVATLDWHQEDSASKPLAAERFQGHLKVVSWEPPAKDVLSFNPSLFPGGVVTAVNSLPIPSDVPVIV